jgi:hypothetical protein
MSDVATYRLDAYEKRADAADARMQRIEDLLVDIRLQIGNARSDNNLEFAKIRVELAGLPSRGALWGMIGTTVAIAIGLIGVFVSVLTYLQAFHIPH